MPPRYIADTHAFLWYLADSPSLSNKAREIFDASEKGQAVIIIPIIVLLESIDIFDKKKVNLKFEDVLLKITQASNFAISEIDIGLIMEVNKTKGFKDLHDRVIVATARIFGAPLISKDKIIRGIYSEVIW